MAQTTDATAGTLGHLTADETRSLQEAWVHLLRLSGVNVPNEKIPDRKDELLEEFTDKSPEAFDRDLWSLMAADHPDATVLRFLRARKWDVLKGVAMLTSAVNWRRERRIDEDIIQGGESVALKATPTTDDEGFIKQYRSGKSYIRGTDNENRPVHIIRSRLHDPNMQSPEAMEAFILHNIESVRMLAARVPIEKACLIFDLGGFGLRNMDFHVIRFLVTVFEARYPETLGAVHVHKAPFVFWGAHLLFSQVCVS
jgi:CRAL/TRIO-like protein